MKNVFRKFLISACLTVCVGAGAAAIGTLSVAPAKAAATEETNYFQMVNGAEVRAVTDSCGLRFTTNVGEYMYDNAWVQDGYTVSFGTLIAKNVTDITAMVAEDESTYLADIPCSKQVAFEDGVFTYTSAVVFDTKGWTDDEKTAAYAMELTARAYVKLEKDGVTTYEYATATDTTRSMRAVANVALVKGASETLLGEYVNVGARNKKDYLETSDATTNTLAVGVAAADLGVYVGAKKVGATGENGAIDLSALATDWTLGETYFVSVFGADNKVYSAPVQYVTKAIENYDDLKGLEVTNELVFGDKSIDGYWALTDNFDFTSQKAIAHGGCFAKTGGTIDSPYASGSRFSANGGVGFKGTFDGNGYTLKVNVDTYGLFGMLMGGSTVKNLSLYATATKVSNASTKGQGASVLSHGIAMKEDNDAVTFENLFVHMADARLESDKTYNLSFINTTSTLMVMENVVISVDESCTYAVTGTLKQGGVFAVTDNSSYSGTFNKNTSNVFVVAENALPMSLLISSGTLKDNYPKYIKGDAPDTVTHNYKDKCYTNFARISTLSAITGVSAYEELPWTYDTATGALVWKN